MGFGLLMVLPILIGQWVGILGLGKTERNRAWGCMMAGTCCTTLGTIGYIVFIGLMMSGHSSPMSSISLGAYSGIASSAFSGIGSLLFAIGFAIHGQQSSKNQQRITELEAIAAAQGEELNRHRVSYESAS